MVKNTFKSMSVYVTFTTLFIVSLTIGCNNNDDYLSETPDDIISGFVVDESLKGTSVYIQYDNDNSSRPVTIETNGYFEIQLFEDDLAIINTKVIEGADPTKENLLIVAENDGRLLRNAITRNIDEIATVYISADTEAYAQYLDSIGKFDTINLEKFNSLLENGRIKNSNDYSGFINNLRDDVTNYFIFEHNKLSNQEIFDKAIQFIDNDFLFIETYDEKIMLINNIMSGGDILLPLNVKVSSDDIDITDKGNGRFTIGSGNDMDNDVFLKIQDNNIFKLMKLKIKEKHITEIAKTIVIPQNGATLGNNSVILDIHPFALNEEVELTINAINSEGETTDGKIILDLQPPGLNFEVPIIVKLRYSDFNIYDPNSVQWLYGTVGKNIDNANIKTIDLENGYIWLEINHFSNLMVKTISEQKFMDLESNFMLIVPRRAYEKLKPLRESKKNNNYYYLRDDIKYNKKIITNRVFEKSSFSGRIGNSVSGGYCAQAVKNIFTSLQHDQRIKSTNFQALLNKGYGYMESIYNKINKNHIIPENVRRYANNSDDIDNSCHKGDIVFIDVLNYEHAGHTVSFYKYYDNTLSVLESNRNGFKTFYFGSYTHDYAIYKNDEDQINMFKPTDSNASVHFICVDPQYFSLDSDGKEIINNYKKVLYKEKLSGVGVSGVGGTFGEFVTEKPWLYYLVDEEGDGINKEGGKFLYNPDLLSVTPLKLRVIDSQRYKLNWGEYHSRYDNYKENAPLNIAREIVSAFLSSESSFPNWINAIINKENNNACPADHSDCTLFGQDNSIYKSFDVINSKTVDDILSHITTIDVDPKHEIVAFEDSRYEIYAEKPDDDNDINFTPINFSESGTLSFEENSDGNKVTLSNACGTELTLYRLSLDINNVSEFKMIHNNEDNGSAKIKTNKKISILFSPTVIDDYYINWGEKNDKHNNNIPIGFWSSYGYDLEFSGQYNTDILLEPKKIYETEDALNLYFMTLGGENNSAQWHFALSGIHAILVHLPGGIGDNEEAEYKLNNYRENPTLMIAKLSSIFALLNKSSFCDWFMLYNPSESGVINKFLFNFDGDEYISLQGRSNIVYKIDAIRLQSFSSIVTDSVAYLSVEVSPPQSVVSYKATLYKSRSVLTKRSLNSSITEYQQVSVLESDSGNFEIFGLEKGNYKVIVNASLNEYKPQTLHFEVIDNSQPIQLPKVILVKNDRKNEIQIRVIDATQQNTVIPNANVTVKFGLDRQQEVKAYEGITDYNGIFQVLDIPYGQYSILSSKDGYLSTNLNISVSDETPTIIDLSIPPVLSNDQIKITLNWKENPQDLDSHLVKKSGGNEDYHIDYSNHNRLTESNIHEHFPDFKDYLDRDDTDAFGPETITIDAINKSSVYTYYIRNFSKDVNDDFAVSIKDSGASVKFISEDMIKTFYPPNEEGLFWKVFDIIDGKVEPCINECMQANPVVFY